MITDIPIADKTITADQKRKILNKIPHSKPFRFIDEIIDINEDFVSGSYTYSTDEFFYKGHFPNNPITPGVILTETMAQIGLLPLGIFLLNDCDLRGNILFTSSDVKFHQVVYPGHKVIVESKKLYFRHNIIKCDVKMYQASRGVVCSGILSGMFVTGL